MNLNDRMMGCPDENPDIWLSHYTRDELKRMGEAGWTAIIPLAATEQHGPHLPVSTDTLICEAIAVQAGVLATAALAERPLKSGAGLLLTPVLPIGCSSHHLAFGGTLSFSSATYLQMLRELGESLVQGGFRRIVFLNGHGGNEPMMHQTAQDLAVAHDVWTASTSYWSVARSALEALQAQEMGLVPGHAGGFETSLIEAIAPSLVRRDRFTASHPSRPWINAGPAGAFIGRHGELTGADGFTDPPTPADGVKGRQYLDAIAGAVAEWVVRSIRWMDEDVRAREGGGSQR